MEPSVEPLSTSTTRSGRSVCASMERRVSSTIPARLYTGMTIVSNGRLSGCDILPPRYRRSLREVYPSMQPRAIEPRNGRNLPPCCLESL